MTLAPVRKTNRDIEQHYFEHFCKAYELPAGIVSYADKPDVLVKGDRTVGIEITNFYLQPGSEPSSEQRQVKRRSDVASEAHKLYLAGGGRGIELTIQFNPLKPITAATRKTLPKAIAAFAASIDAQSTGPFYRNSFPAMPEIESIWLNSRDWPDPKWNRSGQVYSVDEMAADRLREIVADKETKAAEYELCDAYWLLIIVDWIDPAQEQEISTFNFKLASSVFEKIIVYKPGFEEIVVVM